MNLWSLLFSSDPTSSLIEAVRGDDARTVESLLSKNPGLISSIDGDGWNALHWASFRGRSKIAEILLANHADASVKTKDGDSPLHLAVNDVGFKGACHLETVKLFLEHGIEVGVKDDFGRSPIHIAARCDVRVPIAELLVSSGADVNARDDEGQTPLHHAAADGVMRMAEFLLANQADLNARDNMGSTPLLTARMEQRQSMAMFLRRVGGLENDHERNIM